MAVISTKQEDSIQQDLKGPCFVCGEPTNDCQEQTMILFVPERSKEIIRCVYFLVCDNCMGMLLADPATKKAVTEKLQDAFEEEKN